MMQLIIRAFAVAFAALTGLLGIAILVLGLWFADREYVHILEDCVYTHNFTVGSIVLPTYVVSLALGVAGVVSMAFSVIVFSCTGARSRPE